MIGDVLRDVLRGEAERDGEERGGAPRVVPSELARVAVNRDEPCELGVAPDEPREERPVCSARLVAQREPLDVTRIDGEESLSRAATFPQDAVNGAVSLHNDLLCFVIVGGFVYVLRHNAAELLRGRDPRFVDLDDLVSAKNGDGKAGVSDDRGDRERNATPHMIRWSPQCRGGFFRRLRGVRRSVGGSSRAGWG